MRLISQLIGGISRVLQKLPKYFNGSSISKSWWHARAIMEDYAKECTENKVCKLFALTEGIATQDMSAML